jgi:hypothetical protein
LRWQLTDHDVIIAADSPRGATLRRLVTVDPTQTAGDMVVAQPSGIELDQRATIFSLFRGNSDGANRNLYVTVGGVSFIDQTFIGTPDELVLDCTVDDQGHVEACGSVASEVDGLQDFECEYGQPSMSGAPLGRFDPARETPSTTDLFALCKRGLEGYVFRIERVGGGYRSSKALANAGFSELLALGDLNGDKLDDLGVITFDPETLTPIVELHLQCASRDVTCRAENEVPP